MSAEDIKSRLNHLNEEERVVLEEFCREGGAVSDTEIAARINFSPSTVRNLRLNALAAMRPYEPAQFCPYLFGETPPPPPPPPPVIEEETGWPFLRIFAGIVVFAVLISLCSWGYNWITTNRSSTEIPVVEVTRIEEVIVPAPTWTPLPTVTEVAIVEVIETIEVTETYPPITDTPAPTNTPKPTATLIPLLFEESFEGIPSPDLSIRGDNFTLVDGVLHSKGLMRIFTGSSDWTNYAVLLDLSSSGWAPFPDLSNESAGNGGIEIQLRKQDLFNYIAVQIESFRGYCGVRWVEYIDGQGTEILGTRKNIGEEDLCRSSWKAVADGDEYELYLDSDLIIQFPYDSYDRGSVEIAARGRDTQMTIENFRIEDLK